MEAMTGDPTGRALQLLSLLQTYKFWPGNDLAGRLGVSARTLRRDIDRLRTLGYPVDATPGAAGGYRLAAGSHLPPLVLDDDEAVAIAVGLQRVAGAAIDGIEDTSLQALAKLEQVLPDRLRRRVAAVHANIATLRWPGGEGPTVDPDALAVLAQACRDQEEVRFEYRRRDGEETRRLVQPHQLVSAGRRWYLVAWDVRRDAWRTFRLDRLSETRLAGARFAPRELPAADAAAFVASSLASIPKAMEARLLAHGDREAVSQALRWTDFELTGDGNGEGPLEVEVRHDSVDWLVQIIAMLATVCDVTVEGPPEVAAGVERLGQRLCRASGAKTRKTL
jgi:predicted DNA-binding transcriptional regulator YafY